MSKELNLIDIPTTEAADIATQPDMINLDDLSLALIGGGQAGVVF